MSKDEILEEKRKLCADKNYSKLYTRASGKLRRYGVNSEIPGYTLLVYSICIREILGIEIEEDIYQLLEKITIVPSISPVIKNVYPAEQWMKESLRAAGINKDVLEFVEEVGDRCFSEIRKEKK